MNFSYEKRQILHDVSAVIPDKSTTAVIGPSGSGKTTFCNLISRFWDIDSGSVKIGGVDVRDYSSVSVEKARKLNKDAIKEGRCEILSGSVAKLPLEDGYFDAVTAFETIYFWQDIPQCFREVCRVLKSGGMFMICNECSGDNEKDDKWTELVDGMTIYRDDEIKKFLEDARFDNIRINKNERGWLCVTAHI